MKEKINKHEFVTGMTMSPNYNQIIQTIAHLDYCQQVKLLADIQQMVTIGNKRKPKSHSWLGCLSDKTKILGDIMIPIMEEGEWDVLAE